MSDIKADDDVSKDTELIQIEVNDMPSAEQEEEVVKKKYGGMLPKKPPLISKDHERAFFDSADWALGKQEGHAQKPKGPLEALRPKLQPTQQQVRSRRSVYASAESEDGSNGASEGVSDNNDGPNSPLRLVRVSTASLGLLVSITFCMLQPVGFFPGISCGPSISLRRKC